MPGVTEDRTVEDNSVPTFILAKDLGIEFSHNGDNLNIYVSKRNNELLGIQHDEYPVFKDSVAYQPMYDIPFAFNETMLDGAFTVERDNDNRKSSYIHITPDTVLEHSKHVTHLSGVNAEGKEVDVSIRNGEVSVKVDGELIYQEGDLPRDSHGNIKIGEILEPLPAPGMTM